MTDQPYDDQNEIDESQPNWRRKLEADAKAGREAQEALAKQMAETKAMQQELAMRRAGINPDTPQAQLFAKANAELVDVDAIQAEWAKVFPTEQQQRYPQADQAAMQRIAEAQTGGYSGGADPMDFEAKLDEIPIMIDGKWNPNYQQQVLQATSEQAVREGREFNVDHSPAKFEGGGSQHVPRTTPAQG